MPSDNDVDSDVEANLRRASLYSANGKYKKAEALYQRVLSREPDNVRAIASRISVDAALGRITYEDALAKIRAIVDANPDNDRLPTGLITLLARMKRMDEYALERTKYFERFPHSPVALQVQANGLQVDADTKDSPDTPAIAWGYYQRALQSGPLLTPCFREVAFRAARRADPQHAESALAGASKIERLTIRTRVWGPQRMASLYMGGFLLAALLWHPNLTASIAVQSVTLSWGLWAIYCNSQLCCKKCRNAWIAIVSFFSLVEITFDHLSTWYIPAGVAVVLFTWSAATGKLKALSTPPQSREEAERSMRRALTTSVLLMIVVDSYVAGQNANHKYANPDSLSWTLLVANVFFVVLAVARYRRSKRQAQEI